MARNLVPIKVKIGLKPNGHAKYPNFNTLQCVIDAGIDWSNYVDTYGLGWHYDKTSGHKEDTLDSPFGQQWGVLIIPKEFATEALITFPLDITELTEIELEDFYNNKAHAHEPDEKFNTDILAGIKLKQDLSIALTQNQIDALDPNNNIPGIMKNKKKIWVDYKILKGVNIIDTKEI